MWLRRKWRVAGRRAVLPLLLLLVVWQLSAVLHLTPRVGPRFLPHLGADDSVDVQKLVVASQHCHIPDVDPFDDSVRPFLRPEPPIVCSRRPPLSYIAQLKDGGHEVRVDPSSDPVAPQKDLWCCYSNVTRGGDDSQFRVGPCVPFRGFSVRLLPEEEFILVRCNGRHRYTYTNMHALVPAARASAARAAAVARIRLDPTENSPAKRLSVLLVGIDSMSYLSLRRTMPRMVNALKRLGFVGLRMYNKVGGNTLPNMVAALAGLTMEQLQTQCKHDNTVPFDLCPFVWKDFARRGYTTAYAEDTPVISAFRRGGFVTPPTDFYLRPYMLAAEALLERQQRNGLPVCLGPTSTTDHVLNYAEAFLDAMHGSPFFALIWLNNFSHGDHNTPAAMDKRFVRFFDDLAGSNVINDCLVVFFSDHGARFGDIRQTFVGWLEDRLPFFFVSLPEWFRRKYPEAQTSLEANVARLTSPFDVYATLAGLAAGDAAAWGAVKVPGCPACRSLLAGPLPDRTCAEVGVDAEWCTCAARDWPLPIDSAVARRAAEAAFEVVSARLRSAPAGSCATLALHRVVQVRSVQGVGGGGDDVLVVFETEPGGARFEATVQQLGPKSTPGVTGTVSRINSYAGQSECVTDAELKVFCFCES